MTTGEIAVLAGVAVVGFFIITRKQTATSAPGGSGATIPIPRPSTSSNVLNRASSIFGSVGAQAGSLVANAYGAGAFAPAAAKLGSSGAKDALSTTIGTANGLKEIVTGHVTTGVKDVVNNSVVKPVTGLLKAVGGLF